MADGDNEFALEEVGEHMSPDSDSGLRVEEGYGGEPSSRVRGRSFPVGPLPSVGRLAGGWIGPKNEHLK